MYKKHFLPLLIMALLTIQSCNNTSNKSEEQAQRIEQKEIEEEAPRLPISESDSIYNNADMLPELDLGAKYNNTNHYFYENVNVPESYLAHHDTMGIALLILLDKHQKVVIDSTQVMLTKGTKIIGTQNLKDFVVAYHLDDPFLEEFKKSIAEMPYKQPAVKDGEYVSAFYGQGMISIPFSKEKYYKMN